MTITISALTFDAIIGLLQVERIAAQQVIVDCRIEYDYHAQNFIDYVEIITLIETTLKTQQFELLEEALRYLETVLHKTFPNITVLTLKITKPTIIPNALVSVGNTIKF